MEDYNRPMRSRNRSLVAIALCVFLSNSLAVAQSGTPDTETLDGLKPRSIGPASMSGRVVDLAVVESDPYIFYVATATGGLWKTTNNGVTFESIFENQGSHSLGAIAVHQKNPEIVWVGTGERANRQSTSWGDGIYKSTDGGKSWTHLGLAESHHIGRVALHPENPEIAFVAAMGHLWGPNPERGLYKTEDGGQTWTRVLHVDDDTGVVDVAIDHEKPDVLYAATYQRRRRAFGFHGGGPGSGLYKSTNGGKSWKKLSEGLPDGDYGRMGISIYRGDSKIVYVCVEQGYRYNASTAYGERRAGVYRSNDRGESFEFRSDWNPRPMYASQIHVDPTNPERVYMQNAFSMSEDGGKTFRRMRQTLHGDDRILWVNPKDSRHLIKGDDGGVGISYDRAKTWLYVSSLPVSQFYRVSVDMQHPYRVFGGLQDNGSWIGPSATYRSDGILNSDWVRTGGGDGFVNLVHPEDPDTIYVESQYLGLSRLDLKTRLRRDLRPGDPKGRIGPRRNWDAWGPGIPEPELGNAMAPANWDGPFIISPHHADTLYAGTNILWRSRDRGDSWESLGNLTSGVNRRELTIMGQRPHDTTLSLDDGIPYYPTLSVIAESPLQAGLLYVGTDDGRLHVSRDGGKNWQDVLNRLPSIPDTPWIMGIEPSRFSEGRVYVAVNNYRNNDYGNYIYQSDDFGQTWRSISSGLPPERVVRIVREDVRNPDLLFAGTELGLFASIDRGATWSELRGGMPLVAINDLALHPRDNDLVVGTHGRGVWIFDQINAFQELAQVRGKVAHLFSIGPSEMIRYSREFPHMGDMVFRGQNPAPGAVIDFYLREKPEKPEGESGQDRSTAPKIELTILDADGSEVAEVPMRSLRAGLNRVVWNQRYASLPRPAPSGSNESGGPPRRAPGMAGPWVAPGNYHARLRVGSNTYEQEFEVREDPRIDISVEQRRRWMETLFAIADAYKGMVTQVDAIGPVQKQIQKLSEGGAELDGAAVEESRELNRMIRELFGRTSRLYGQVGQWPGPMTQLQESQFDYYKKMQGRLGERLNRLISETVPRLNTQLSEEEKIETGSSR